MVEPVDPYAANGNYGKLRKALKRPAWGIVYTHSSELAVGKVLIGKDNSAFVQTNEGFDVFIPARSITHVVYVNEDVARQSRSTIDLPYVGDSGDPYMSDSDDYDRYIVSHRPEPEDVMDVETPSETVRKWEDESSGSPF